LLQPIEDRRVPTGGHWEPFWEPMSRRTGARRCPGRAECRPRWEDQPVVLPRLADRHPLGRLTSAMPTQHLDHLRRQGQRPPRLQRPKFADH
jgi:hypothetical protein